MEMLAISAIYTNTVFALIDSELGSSRLSDPDAARRQVLITFQAIPVDTLKAALAEAANQVVGGRFSTDLTGSGNIHFTHIPAGDFVADPRGLTWPDQWADRQSAARLDILGVAAPGADRDARHER
jgi:hypothetical protein